MRDEKTDSGRKKNPSFTTLKKDLLIHKIGLSMH
jgi:hypothetical protein